MIDVNRIAKSTDRYNFHCHTQFCDGHAPMQDFVNAALDIGLEHLGFSPHSPLTFATNCNMAADDVPAYLAEVKRLQKFCEGRGLNIYASMEIDYIDSWGPASDYFKSLPLDYRIGSVHFIPSLVHSGRWIDIDGCFSQFMQRMEREFDNDIVYVVNTFFEQSMKMVDAGGFDIIGHLDKIAHNAGDYQPGIDDEPWFEQKVRTLIENVMDHHMTIEVNTKAWTKFHRFFPAQKWFKLLKRWNVPIVVNSDSHYPHLLNSARHLAFALLAE